MFRPGSGFFVAFLAPMAVFVASLGAAGAVTASTAPVSATFAAVGPFATTTGTITEGAATYDVFRPADYEGIGFKSPIVTWGNGTGAVPTDYTTLLSHFASYGFTVIFVSSLSFIGGYTFPKFCTARGHPARLLESPSYFAKQATASEPVLTPTRWHRANESF